MSSAKKGREKLLLSEKLASYGAIAGAFLAIPQVSNTQINYSGIKNIIINTPNELHFIDLNNDTINDFAFKIDSNYREISDGKEIKKFFTRLGVIINPRLDLYKNSWMVRNTSVTFFDPELDTIKTSYFNVLEGLAPNQPVGNEGTKWSNCAFPYWPGALGKGTLLLSNNIQIPVPNDEIFGDINGTERFIGIRFHKKTNLHYGWIRVKTDKLLDTITIVDWAYENTPNKEITTSPEKSGVKSDLEKPKVSVSKYYSWHNNTPLTITLKFSEKIYALKEKEIEIVGGMLIDAIKISDGLAYNLLIQPKQTNTIKLIFREGTFTDFAGNKNELINAQISLMMPSSSKNTPIHEDRIYPNPAHQFIEFDLPELSAIKFTDLNGSLVFSQQNIQQSTIDIGKLKPGLYTICIKNTKGISHQKILVQ